MENQSIRDLIFNPILYSEYPYQYKKKKDDGTTIFTFSKKPIISPSLVERIDIEKKIKNIKICDYDLFRRRI